MQGGPNLVESLIRIGREIDADLAVQNQQRALALAKLAANLIATQGQYALPEEAIHLMRFGEQFFRWRYFDEGADYYKALWRIVDRSGGGDTELGQQAIALAGGFDFLRGGMDSKPDVAQSCVKMVEAIFGAGHPLSQAVKERAAAKGIGMGPSGAFGSPQWDMAPKAPPPPPANSAVEPLALWVTLAFLRVSAADGKVDEREYLVWKNAMQQMDLPDVWEKYGADGLKNMLQQGKLQELSVVLSSLPKDARVRLGTLLRSIMLADQQVDKDELIAVAECARWLGLTLPDIGIQVEFG